MAECIDVCSRLVEEGRCKFQGADDTLCGFLLQCPGPL